MPPSVDFVAQILEKIFPGDSKETGTTALWKAKLCMFLQGGWIGAYEG